MIRYLLPRLRSRGVETIAASLYASGLTPAEIQELHTPVYDCGRRGRWDIGALRRLAEITRGCHPDIMHTHVFSGKYWGRMAALVARRDRAARIVIIPNGLPVTDYLNQRRVFRHGPSCEPDIRSSSGCLATSSPLKIMSWQFRRCTNVFMKGA